MDQTGISVFAQFLSVSAAELWAVSVQLSLPLNTQIGHERKPGDSASDVGHQK